MLSSIHPLGERARHNRWAITATAFTIGAVIVGAAIGALAGLAGSAFDGAWRWAAVGATTLLAGLLDISRVTPPGPRRQVNEDWIGTFRGWVYGIGFGAQLGAGAATYVVTWGVWATLVAAFLAGGPLPGAIVGATFGIGRSVLLLLAGRVDRPSRLTSFNRRMADLASPVARGVAVAFIALGIVGAAWSLI